jgi:serine/threonine-protein kinase
VLYRSLAGRMPWQASTTTQMLKAHYYTDPAPLPPVPGLPREVAVLVRRCLAKQPGDRPTAHQVAEVLGDLAGLPPATLLHNASAPGAPAVRGSERGRRRTLGVGAARKYLSGRRRSAVAAGAATAVMATGLAIWAMDEPRNGSPAVAVIPVAACAVRYASSATPNGGTTTTITISNTGPVQMHPWRLAVALPDGRRLVRGWSAAWQQQGDVIYADGPSLPVGGLLTTGFETSKSRSTSRPMAFTVNDTPCHADSVRQPAIASPPPTTRIPVGQTTTVTKPKPSPPAKSKPATRKSASVEPKSKATTKNPTSVKPKGENKGKDKGKGENKSKGKGENKGKGKGKDKDKDKRKDHGKSQKKGKQKAKGKGAKSSTSTA